ncbi:AraC family transcriptional regulator [soil metagenome]
MDGSFGEWFSAFMRTTDELLNQINDRIATHARDDLSTSIDGLLLAKVVTTSEEPEYSLTEPLLVLMTQGGKRLLLGDQAFEYRRGQCLVVTADLPVTGHYIDITPGAPSLSLGVVLRPAAVAALLLQQSTGRRRPPGPGPTAIATGRADDDLLDALARMLQLLDRPADAPVLAPLIEQEILWRLLTGPLGGTVRQIGLADSDLAHITRAISWIRDNYAAPMAVVELARLAGMSASTLHRRFRAVTAMSPLQFQKRIRLQHARTLLLTRPGDIAGVGHSVGYDSPSQFTREYRRLFGVPPGLHAAGMRADDHAEKTLV